MARVVPAVELEAAEAGNQVVMTAVALHPLMNLTVMRLHLPLRIPDPERLHPGGTGVRGVLGEGGRGGEMQSLGPRGSPVMETNPSLGSGLGPVAGTMPVNQGAGPPSMVKR